MRQPFIDQLGSHLVKVICSLDRCLYLNHKIAKAKKGSRWNLKDQLNDLVGELSGELADFAERAAKFQSDTLASGLSSSENRHLMKLLNDANYTNNKIKSAFLDSPQFGQILVVWDKNIVKPIAWASAAASPHQTIEWHKMSELGGTDHHDPNAYQSATPLKRADNNINWDAEVVVIDGQWKGQFGIVHYINQGVATVMLRNPIGSIKSIKVPITSLQRAFSPGERVKDSHGNYHTITGHSNHGIYMQDDNDDMIYSRPSSDGLQRKNINPGYD